MRRGVHPSDDGFTSGRHQDRKSTRLNSSHDQISYAVFCLKKKSHRNIPTLRTSTNLAPQAPDQAKHPHARTSTRLARSPLPRTIQSVGEASRVATSTPPPR